MTTSDLPVFGNYGVPTGEQADQFWRNMITSLFTHMEPKGWDQPHSLWAVLTSTATLAESPILVDLPIYDGDDTVTVQYGMKEVARFTEHPRVMLPGFKAEPGTAALILVNEAWTRSLRLTPEEEARILRLGDHSNPPTTEEEQAAASLARGLMRSSDRPSLAEDRVEIRQAFIIEPDGSYQTYSHERGTDVTRPEGLTRFAPGGAEERLTGVIPDLILRCFNLPVNPDVSLAEVLGRVAMVAVTQLAAQNPTQAQNPSAIVTGTFDILARMVDGLSTPPEPGEMTIDMGAIFTTRGTLTGSLPEMLQHVALGPLYLQCRKVAKGGWSGFFASPGHEKWIVHDENNTLLTPALREWYGPGHLVRFIDERIPAWGTAFEDMSRTTGREIAGMVYSILEDVGWRYGAPVIT